MLKTGDEVQCILFVDDITQPERKQNNWGHYQIWDKFSLFLPLVLFISNIVGLEGNGNIIKSVYIFRMYDL